MDCFGVLVSNRGVVSVISGAIVKQEYFVNLLPDFFWNAIERPVEFIDGIVRNHEYSDSLFLLQVVCHFKNLHLTTKALANLSPRLERSDNLGSPANHVLNPEKGWCRTGLTLSAFDLLLVFASQGCRSAPTLGSLANHVLNPERVGVTPA